MRGSVQAPQPLPAQLCDTRIQQVVFSSFLPSWSQWNWTLMRPYLSVQISSPDFPVTMAVWVPAISGRGVPRGGRQVMSAGKAVKVFAYSLREAV